MAWLQLRTSTIWFASEWVEIYWVYAINHFLTISQAGFLSFALLSFYSDLADWLGVGDTGLFNFKPSVRPVPLEVHIQASSVTILSGLLPSFAFWYIVTEFLIFTYPVAFALPFLPFTHIYPSRARFMLNVGLFALLDFPRIISGCIRI